MRCAGKRDAAAHEEVVGAARPGPARKVVIMTNLTRAAAAEEDALNSFELELLEGDAVRLCGDEAVVNRTAVRRVVRRFRAAERRRRFWIAAGSALSLAAAATLLRGLSSLSTPHIATAQVGSALQQSSLVVELGSVSVSGAGNAGRGTPVTADALAELSPGTCLRSGSHVRLCSSGGAKLKLPALGRAWNVELAAGGVTVDLQTMPAGFSIRTLHGVAAVEGALFSIELDASLAFTTVLVQRGRVHVTNEHLREQALLIAGESARLGERLEVLGRDREPPEVDTQAAPRVRPPSDKRPAAQQGSLTPAHQIHTSASDLLEEARQARGVGHYAQAAQLYRKLVQQHAESAEARASLVSLGQLELGQLGQPEAALDSFHAYLAKPGQLRQEAEYGVISALQRLGRTADERHAIEAFLARYPKSTPAGALSQRLKQL